MRYCWANKVLTSREDIGGLLRLWASLITLLLTASTAHAETWHQLANLDKNGGAIFVDTSSIDRDSEIRKARFKFVYTADRPIGSGYSDVAPGVQSYRWELKLGHFNCTDSTAVYSQSTLYNADDQAVGNIAVDPSILKFQKVAPETVRWCLAPGRLWLADVSRTAGPRGRHDDKCCESGRLLPTGIDSPR